MFSRKIRRRLIRLFILSVIGGAGYAIYKPEIIPDEAIRDQVIGARTQAIEIGEEVQTHVPKDLTQKLPLPITDKLPNGAVLGDQEIEVEAVLGIITDEVKKLPAKQIKNIKREFCADVIYEATTSATQ